MSVVLVSQLLFWDIFQPFKCVFSFQKSVDFHYQSVAFRPYICKNGTRITRIQRVFADKTNKTGLDFLQKSKFDDIPCAVLGAGFSENPPNSRHPRPVFEPLEAYVW